MKTKEITVKIISYFFAVLICFSQLSVFAEETTDKNSTETISFGEGIGKITSTTEKIIGNKVTQKKYTALNSTSGEQAAFTLEYKTDSGILPLAVNSNKIYGGKTMQSMAKNEVSKGNKVIGGINADFFGMKNGVPIGLMMQEGILKSANPGNGRYAVAFKGSGEAAIVKPDIAITIALNEKTVESSKVRLNKTPFWSEVYILTNEWAATTKTDYDTNEYIARIKSGNFYPGTDMKLEITEVRKNVQNGSIPKGCVAIVGNHEALNDAETGDEVTISIRENTGALIDIKQIVGGGDLLVKDGKLMTSFDPGISSKNPRSGLGIRADGSVVLAVVDGRLPGYSQGLTMKDFAAFMANLGCVDAINFDGGGSSTMVCVPQNSNQEVAAINIPSNSGSLQRSVANGILLIDADETPHKSKSNFKSADIYSDAAKRCDYNGDGRLQNYELNKLDSIAVRGKNIGGISDLYMLPQIKELILENCNISDISPIAALTNLKTLNLNNNKIYSLEPLKKLSSLSALYIKNNKISDLSPLKDIPLLTNLDASYNLLKNLSGLENKKFLNYVWLNNNNLKDISAFEKSTLNYLLDLHSNKLTDISPLAYQNKLQRLDSSKNNINSISLDGCTALYSISLRENNITDLPDSFFELPLKNLDISVNNIPFSFKEKLDVLKSRDCSVLNEYQGPSSPYRTDEKINIWYSAAAGVLVNGETVPGDTNIVLSGKRHFNVTLPQSVTKETYSFRYRINGTYEDCDILEVKNGNLESAVIEENEIFISQNSTTEEFSFDFILSDFADIDYFADESLSVPIAENSSTSEANFITIYAKVTSDNGQNSKKYKITYKRPDEILNFTDISNHYAKDAIKKVSRLGIVKGYPVNGYLFSFDPDANSSRSEAAAFIMRTLGTDVTKFGGYKMIFVDEIEKWAYDYVKCANALSISEGESAGSGAYKFCGQNNITRVEFVAMLARAFGYSLGENEEINLNFADNNKIPDWGMKYIKIGVKYGLLKGYQEDNTIRAEDYITRGEIAQIIYRIINNGVF